MLDTICGVPTNVTVSLYRILWLRISAARSGNPEADPESRSPKSSGRGPLDGRGSLPMLGDDGHRSRYRNQRYALCRSRLLKLGSFPKTFSGSSRPAEGDMKRRGGEGSICRFGVSGRAISRWCWRGASCQWQCLCRGGHLFALEAPKDQLATGN